MKSISRLLKGFTLSLAAIGVTTLASAQGSLPVCSGTGSGMIYLNSNDSVWRFDPSTPATAPTFTGLFMPAIPPTSKGVGLAVSRNINGGATSPTYYTTMTTTTASRLVHYWDAGFGAWINTGHVLNQDHIAGGGGHLYGLDLASGFVFQYDGNAPGAPPGAFYVQGVGAVQSDGVQDIAADCSGNFYVITTTGTGATLKKYSPSTTYPPTAPNSALLATYTLTGTFGAGGGGLAVDGNRVYYDGADGKLYTGIISGTTVNFFASTATPFNANRPVSDFASCGSAGFNGNVGSIDTFKSCNGATNITLNATGPGPYNWTVVSGPATITGSGASVVVNSPTTSVITHLNANCAGVNAILDTNVIFVANATIKIDTHAVIYSCGQPVYDSVKAHISNTSPGVSYAYDWKPSALFIPPSNTDTTGYFQISKSTWLTLEVSTLSGCLFKDSIFMRVVDSTPKADFQYVRKYGCDQDTVVFFNTSYGGVDSFAWYFYGDTNRTNSYPYPVYSYTDATNPTWIYKNPRMGYRPVRLLAKNLYCTDTITKQIDLEHTLFAYFGVDGNSLDTNAACVDHPFQFRDSSKSRYPPPVPVGYRPATISYYFGDGTSVTGQANPLHTYKTTGTYIVSQVLVDFKGCTDTFRKVIIVDSIPFVRLITPDTGICQGQAVRINAEYLTVGSTGTTLDMGDGSVFPNTTSTSYSYETPGTYNVTFTANYRYCPPSTQAIPIKVKPFPGIDIGPDTVLCPYGQPVVLSDRANLGSTTAKYLWNTGEKTQAIYARNIGTYWARVDVDGCTATDSLVIRKDCYIEIPNSFTPNGDGTNDYFLPRQYLSRSVNEFKMVIFNRWGQKVFETEAINGRGWDGKFNGVDQPQGVFVYQIDVGFDSGVKEHYTGNLTLLR